MNGQPDRAGGDGLRTAISRILKETLVASTDVDGLPIISGINTATSAILALVAPPSGNAAEPITTEHDGSREPVWNPPPSGNAGERAGAEQMVREGRAITVIIPTGYDSAWDFLHDCGLEAVYDAAPLQPAPDAMREALENLPEEVSDNALWALASALHSNAPEEKRPMSWSDFSPEQIERLHQAANAFLAALTSPSRRSLAQGE